MIVDKQLEFSNAQTVLASAPSTNSVDLGGRGHWGRGSTPEATIPVILQVDQAFNNLTSLRVDVRSSPNADMSAAITHGGATVLLADLEVGDRMPALYLPSDANRYVDLYYTITGTAPTTGKITARGGVAHQLNR